MNVDKAKTHEFFFFGGGEGHIKLKPEYLNLDAIKILLCFRNDSSIFRVLLAVDALRGLNPSIKIELFIPYFPGGRQDRRCVEGEPLTVGVYASVINALNLDRVHIYDPHSDVTPAFIQRVKVHKNHYYAGKAIHSFRSIAKEWDNMVLVSPDAGANKKVYDLAKYLNLDAIRADKIRDVKTGKIVETTVYAGSLEGKYPVIVDDVCARGGTFMALAKVLTEKHNAEGVGLVLSFWEGIANTDDMKKSGITKIFITNGLADCPYNDYVETYNVFEFMGLSEDELFELENE